MRTTAILAGAGLIGILATAVPADFPADATTGAVVRPAGANPEGAGGVVTGVVLGGQGTPPAGLA